uniref:PID domain-containing protein n=1 Tax=Macrostomum lignano TaxID=282301 RepID=A0A1I8IRQ9_9PLAT
RAAVSQEAASAEQWAACAIGQSGLWPANSLGGQFPRFLGTHCKPLLAVNSSTLFVCRANRAQRRSNAALTLHEYQVEDEVYVSSLRLSRLDASSMEPDFQRICSRCTLLFSRNSLDSRTAETSRKLKLRLAFGTGRPKDLAGCTLQFSRNSLDSRTAETCKLKPPLWAGQHKKHRVEDLWHSMAAAAAAPQGVRHALQRSRSRCSSTGGGPGGRQLDALVEADESEPQQPPPLPPTATAQQPRRQHRRRRQSIFSLSRLRQLLSLRPAPLPLPPPQPPQPPKPQRAHLAAVPAKCLGAVPLSSAPPPGSGLQYRGRPVEQLVAAAAAARRRQRNSLASTATTAEGSSVLPVAMVTVSVGGLTVQPLEQNGPSLTRLTPTGSLAAAPDSRASSADTQRHPIESVVCASVHRRLPRIFCCAIVDSDATAACHAFLCARTDSADCLVQAVARVCHLSAAGP